MRSKRIDHPRRRDSAEPTSVPVYSEVDIPAVIKGHGSDRVRKNTDGPWHVRHRPARCKSDNTVRECYQDIVILINGHRMGPTLVASGTPAPILAVAQPQSIERAVG
jgi:hypothetical protein